MRIASPRRRRRGLRRSRLRLPGGFFISRAAILIITLLAALLLALGLHSHLGHIPAPEGLQTSFAGSNSAEASDKNSLQAAAKEHAGPGTPSEFPADFSADLAVDPASSFLAPLSRGSAFGNANITALAVSRLGDACFQPSAAPGEYLDCSSLVQWCYSSLGINVPRTAAGQAEYCQQRSLTVPRSQLQCGDLIFWSFEKNGRFKDISHTGIYAGNGKIIDASYSRGQVVYRDLYSPEQIVMYGRIPTGR